MSLKIKQLEHLCAGIDHEIFQDDILMANARIGAQHYGISLKECTPTFILKADDDFVAMIIQGSRRIDFKKVRQFLGAKNIRMASPEEILDLTESPVGSVSMINPHLQTLIDTGITELESCYGGCGVEHYTLKISSQGLIKITEATVGDFTKAAS
jgi:prolyl-tRNA editing enzyme YbaK/EbsC (Cys-tRNA(Pro) deacylase)